MDCHFILIFPLELMKRIQICLWSFSLPFSTHHALTYTLLSNDVCLIGAYGLEEWKDFFSWCPHFMLWTWKYLNTPPKKCMVMASAFIRHLLLFTRILCTGLPCQLAITNIMITHPQVQPYSMTLIKTGIVYKREITLNAILVTLKCTRMDPIVFLDNSSFCDKCSQLLCCPNFLEWRITLRAFSWELLITRLNLHGEI